MLKATPVKQPNNQTTFLFEANELREILSENLVSLSEFGRQAKIGKSTLFHILSGGSCNLLTATKIKKTVARLVEEA